MIGKVVRGQRVAGLLRYLFGPGRSNEHTDPHLAAAWDTPSTLEPPVGDDGQHDVRTLAGLLDQPLLASPKPSSKSVWHCALRTAPEDRRLTDAEWDDAVRTVLDRTRLAPRGDDGACRWVAVRHADDHVHVVVTLARQDGRAVSPSNDYYRVGEACRAVEEQYGLRRTADRDRTPARRPTRGEQEKAIRAHRPEAPRVALRRAVQRAADGPGAFLVELRRAGVLVKLRLSETQAEQVTGYAVALPGDHNAAGEPVWFGGGKLAADLTWQKLQARWAAGTETGSRAGGHTAANERAAAWDAALRAAVDGAAEARRTADAINSSRAASTDEPGNEANGTVGTGSSPSDLAAAAGDLLVGAARVVEGPARGPLTRAADTFERASREPWGVQGTATPASRRLRATARALTRTGRTRSTDAGHLQHLLVAAAGLVDAVAELRTAQRRPAQAAAARRAAAVLRRASADLRRQRTANRPRTSPRRAPGAAASTRVVATTTRSGT